MAKLIINYLLFITSFAAIKADYNVYPKMSPAALYEQIAKFQPLYSFIDHHYAY